jgi:nucleoside-diphosphate-sugar epimerase
VRVLVIGAGLVGQELARQLRADGHTVVATTTTPAKAESLAAVADEVRVLRGSDAPAVAAALADVDAVAVCAGPSAQRGMTPEDRAATYREILVDTARSVVDADFDGPVVALSSLSVYGDAADGEPEVTEESPLTDYDDASPQSFQEMERSYLEGAPGRACVFRCADIFGGEDPPIEAKVQMAHTYLNGSVPFSDKALFYRVEVRDVAAAIRHALTQHLTGVYNLTHPEVPPSNAACFDGIGARLGLPAMEYRGELKGPAAPVSVDRLLSSGFTFEHTRAEPLPEPAA